MNSQLYHNILCTQQYDSDATESMIKLFLPQIHKYGRLLESDDTCQALILFLIELLRKLPIEQEHFKNDRILYAYISKSIKHKYIELSKNKDRITTREVELSADFTLADPHRFEISLLYFDLLQLLKPLERRILIWVYFYGYSISELSKILHVSKQALNKTKLRALKKLHEL